MFKRRVLRLPVVALASFPHLSCLWQSACRDGNLWDRDQNQPCSSFRYRVYQAHSHQLTKRSRIQPEHFFSRVKSSYLSFKAFTSSRMKTPEQ